MPDSETDDRIAQLLTRADEAANQDRLPDAFKALKEASHLDSQNQKVRDALVELQRRERSGDALRLLRSYLSSGPELDGDKAVQALRQKELPQHEALEALDLLLAAVEHRDQLDPLTGTLITRDAAVRKEIAARFREPVTELFTQLFERGEESLRAFAGLPLDASLWPSKDAQSRAQDDVFRLCIAKLIDVDVDCPERLMQVVARQLAVAPDNVKDVIDDDVFEVILNSLDIRLDAKLRSQAMLATSKTLEALGEKGETMFGQYLVNKVAKQTNDDLIDAFSAAAAVFPMIPTVAASLFMTDGFIQQLVPNLEKNSEAVSHGQRKSRTLEQAALELLSAACVDKSCRESIDRYCSHWLRDLSDERDGTHKALSALILAKINSASQEEITTKLADLVLVGDAEREQAVEGLAYTSLEPKIKEEIASNPQLLKGLVAALTERPSAAFGCLTVFSNLTVYKPAQTAEQKKMAQLKAYANSQKLAADDPLDEDSRVTARVKKLLDVDVVPALVASCRQNNSPSKIAMVVRTLLSMTKEQQHRSKMAQQGAVRLLLQIRERIAKTDKSTAEASAIERNASHALARLLISVNPAHVFSSNLSASSAVSALVPLLSLDKDGEQRDLLPTFEALLALTNLASMGDEAVTGLLLRSSFDTLEDLLFSTNTLVQRASVELVCNLMASPAGVAKFADGSNDARRRMQILLALADVEDLPTRRAAGGALAMLTEWDAAVSAVLDKERGIKVLLGLCAEETDEMRHRGFACIVNVLNAPGEVGTRALGIVKDSNGPEILKEALRKTKSQEILGLGVEALKKLQ